MALTGREMRPCWPRKVAVCNSEKDLDTLKIWNKGAAKVDSVDEFVEKFLKGR